jgi:hypothetical protein
MELSIGTQSLLPALPFVLAACVRWQPTMESRIIASRSIHHELAVSSDGGHYASRCRRVHEGRSRSGDIKELERCLFASYRILQVLYLSTRETRGEVSVLKSMDVFEGSGRMIHCSLGLITMIGRHKMVCCLAFMRYVVALIYARRYRVAIVDIELKFAIG